MLRFVWLSQCIPFAYLLNYHKVKKIFTYFKELSYNRLYLLYNDSISYFSDRLPLQKYLWGILGAQVLDTKEWNILTM